MPSRQIFFHVKVKKVRFTWKMVPLMDPCNAIPDSDHRKRAAGRAPSPLVCWNILHELLSSAKMKQTGREMKRMLCKMIILLDEELCTRSGGGMHPVQR